MVSKLLPDMQKGLTMLSYEDAEGISSTSLQTLGRSSADTGKVAMKDKMPAADWVERRKT